MTESSEVARKWPIFQWSRENRYDPAALIAAVVTPIALALVAADVIILFVGVIARYFLDTPLTWTDDLAAMVFLWLAMLGSVVAMCRNRHMGISIIAPMLGPRWQGRVDTFVNLLVVVFFGALVLPAIEFWQGQIDIVNPALDISDGWRSSALPIGIALLVIVSLAKLFRNVKLGNLLWALCLLAVAWLLLTWQKSALIEMGNLNLAIFFVVILGVTVLSGVQIAFAFGLATLSYIATVTDVPSSVLINRMDVGMSNSLLLAIPMFVYLGLLIEATGMARTLVAFLVSWLGHVRGGLHYVLLVAMYLVSGISGSKAADMAAIAPVLLPDMKRRGENPGELIGLLSASGAMAETIPPSLVLITIGSVTGVSIADLFAGGLLPALVAAIFLGALVAVRVRTEHCVVDKKANWSQIAQAGIAAAPTLALPFLIRYAVLNGIATATEVSTMGVVYSLLVGACMWRQVQWNRMLEILAETASLSGAVLILIGMATAMAWALTQSGFSHDLVAFIRGMPGGRYGFLAISLVIFIILGSVLEGIPAIVVFGPLLFPAAKLLGINEVHYAMVSVLAMGVGLFAPPFGIGFYTACAIGRVEPEVAMRRTVPYLIAVTLATIVVALVPDITTALIPHH